MNFCSNCGSDALKWEIPLGDNRPRYQCSNCGTIFYQNPKIVVGCLALWEGKVLLCKRGIEPRKGLWNLPAGYLENGETVESGALRELWEEAGAKLKLWHQHTLYSLTHVNQVYIHFIGDLIEGKHHAGEETLDSQLFAPEDIPWSSIAFTSTEFAIRRYLESDTTPDTPIVHLGEYIPK
ncbi:MAG TPA: hypothetical protein DCE41_11425 [Cytophagales bacterium]|nr:hypothetical protein [Cytophagales bacterium]HAA22305.1 hypothetical protein [Cytophagales bacterium]HAP60482.1 hypothetical protein [Cytophagales bacterium]